MKTLTFLLATVIELYTMIMLLRVWMQWARCDFYNPFSQFVVKVTQPVVGPLRRIIPAMGPIDSSSLLIAFILCVVKAIVLFMVVTFQPIIWISALLILIKTVGLLIFWVLLLMAIMSWVSQGRSPVEFVLMQLADPLLRLSAKCCRQWAVSTFRRWCWCCCCTWSIWASPNCCRRRVTFCFRGCGWRYECRRSLR